MSGLHEFAVEIFKTASKDLAIRGFTDGYEKWGLIVGKKSAMSLLKSAFLTLDNNQ